MLLSSSNLRLGSNELSLTADTKYPTLGGDFQLTCTLDMGELGWPVRIHRDTGVGIGSDCGQCTYPLYNGETGPCTDWTTATYNVQCTVEGTDITMVFDVTGVTNTEIGQWTCNPTVGLQPEETVNITELGKTCSVLVSTALLVN